MGQDTPGGPLSFPRPGRSFSSFRECTLGGGRLDALLVPERKMAS